MGAVEESSVTLYIINVRLMFAILVFSGKENVYLLLSSMVHVYVYDFLICFFFLFQLKERPSSALLYDDVNSSFK